MGQKEGFPIIECTGTSYDIGRIHGTLAKKQVDTTIAVYQSMFKDYSHIDWDTAKQYARTFISTITAYDADLMEEMRGLADGSGHSLDDILALNVRSEIVLQGGQVGQLCDGGCTSFAFIPVRTESQETWLGQNWDWRAAEQKGCVLLHIRQKAKPDILMATEAGIIGKIGLNSAGVGVALNALASNAVTKGPVLPLHIALRGVLDSRTLSDAIRAAGTMNLACCANFTMASASGQAVCAELGPGDMDVIYADEGYCCHTNHFYSPRMALVKDTGRIMVPDTYLRLGRVRDLIRSCDKPIRLKDMKCMLRDHLGYPDSICRHEDPAEPAAQRMGTIFSVIMNLNRKEIHLAPGNPCEHRYHSYKL